MEVKEVLDNYNNYIARIAILKKQIYELEERRYSLQSANLDGMPKPKGYTTSRLEEKVVNIQDKIDKKNNDIKELEINLNVVRTLIKTLRRYNQELIEWKYIDKMSIEEIANRKDRTYDSIRKTINISIEKMQKEYNKITQKKEFPKNSR